MSRYIDVDAVKNIIRSGVSTDTEADQEYVCERIDEAPSIEIVRCRECKHWERLNYEAPKEGWCDDQMPYSDGRWVDADDFCSYGERKESE